MRRRRGSGSTERVPRSPWRLGCVRRRVSESWGAFVDSTDDHDVPAHRGTEQRKRARATDPGVVRFSLNFAPGLNKRAAKRRREIEVKYPPHTAHRARRPCTGAPTKNRRTHPLRRVVKENARESPESHDPPKEKRWRGTCYIWFIRGRSGGHTRFQTENVAPREAAAAVRSRRGSCRFGSATLEGILLTRRTSWSRGSRPRRGA